MWKWIPCAAYVPPVCLSVLHAIAGGGGGGGGAAAPASASLALTCLARLLPFPPPVLHAPDGWSVRLGRLVSSLPGVLANALEVGQGAQGRSCGGSRFIGQKVLLIPIFPF